MSAPLQPPPLSDYGAFTVPRILQRWLDVNPITALTRTQAFITLPSFSQAVTWQGYSDIVVAFNYEGPNNFTLTGFNVEPYPTPNYCLCIAWRDENGNMNRYSLWRGVGETIYGSVQPYSGQKIAKNFRFEIWTTNSSPAVQVAPISIYTSVLGGVDYRYGADFVLVTNDTAVTAFGVSDLATVTYPTTGLVAHWRADTNFSGGTWIDNVSAFELTSSGSVVQATPSGCNGQKVIDISAGSLINSGNVVNIPITGGAFVFIVCAQKSVGSNGIFFQLNDNFATTILTVSSEASLGGYAIDGYAINDTQATAYPTFRVFQISETFGSISNFSGYQISGINLGSSSNTAVGLLLTEAPVYIAEILIYSGFSSNAEAAQLQLYLAQRYAGSNQFSLPLTFPSNSSPTINVI